MRLKAKRRCIIHTRSRAGAKNGRAGVCVAHVHSCPLGQSGDLVHSCPLMSTHVHSCAIGQSRPLRRSPPPPPVLAGCGGGRGRGALVFGRSCPLMRNRALGQSGVHVHSCPLGQSGDPPTAPRPSIFWVGVWARLLCAMGNVDVPREVKTAAFDGREPGRATSTRLPRTAIPSPTLPHPGDSLPDGVCPSLRAEGMARASPG